MSRKRHNTIRPTLETLEERAVPSASPVWVRNGNLYSVGTNGHDTASVNSSISGKVFVNLNGSRWTFASWQIPSGRTVYFWGLYGDDHFTNNTATLHTAAIGGNGNDPRGSNGSGTRLALGRGGRRRLVGNAGNDVLLGGTARLP
jgi:hypothetical protein